jgi:Concanavalin A-like lectin/glucanases superfamily/Glycoside hydrolase 123, N-terminal domain
MKSMRSLVVLVVLVAAMLAWMTPAIAADAPKDLLFGASFNRHTAFADIAKGDPKCSLATSLELRAKRGVTGSCLLLEEGETCRYEAKGNINFNAGTVSFWVKPHNWSDADNRYVNFFYAGGRDENDMPYSISINKSAKPGNVRVYWTIGRRRKDPDFKQLLLLGKAKWEPGKWVKVDATWDANNLSIYVNGKLSNKSGLTDFKVPELKRSFMSFIPIYTGKAHHERSSDDRTFIDEIEIFSGAQSPDRIMERYLGSRPDKDKDFPVHIAAVPKLSGLTLDGKLTEKVWAKATTMPILNGLVNGLPASLRASTSIWYDDTAIYLGFWSEKENPTLKSAAGREGPIWLDDAFEWFLMPHEKAEKDYYQWLINAKGSWFDIHVQNKKWTCEGFQIKTHEEKDWWSAEVVIPFASMKQPTPKPGTVWRANFVRDWARTPPQKQFCTSWSYVGPSLLKNYERWGKLVFLSSDQGAAVSILPGLNAGALGVHTLSAKSAKASVSVESEERGVFNKTKSGATRQSFKALLSDVQTGLLAVKVTGADDAILQQYHTRFTVKQPIDVTYIPRVLDEKMELICDFGNVSEDVKKLLGAGKVKLRITSQGPKRDAADETFVITKQRQTCVIPFRYELGQYTLTYALTAPGRAKPISIIAAINVPSVEWVGTQLGITDEVLKPFTPLTYNADGTIGCWNRAYTLKGPLPQKVAAFGKPMLRGPVTLAISTDKGVGQLATTSSTKKLAKPNRAEFAGKARFGDVPVDVDWSTWMEYDGLVVSTFTLTPPKGGIMMKDLTLRIPLRPDVVEFVRGERKHPNRTYWDGKFWQSGFEPFIWTHNPDEGFLYFCESEANWVFPKGAKVTTVRGGKDAGIELKLIANNVKVTEPITYTFGFQATPIKPLPKDRRLTGFGRSRSIPYQTHQPWLFSYSNVPGIWAPNWPDKIRTYREKRDAEGAKVFFYACTSCQSNAHPAYTLFKTLWHNAFSSQFGPYEKKPATNLRPAIETQFQMPVCPGAPSHVDRMIWNAWNMYKTTGSTHFYTDTDSVWACENRHHGHAFTDVFGKKGVSYTIFSKRKFGQRMAALVRKMKTPDGERGKWLTHCHSKVVPPVHGWADYFWPGEQYAHQMYGNPYFYMDTLPESSFRTEFAGRPSGLPHVMLPQFVRGTRNKKDIDQPYPSISLLSMVAVNDVLISSSYMHLDSVSELWKLHNTLDTPKAKFIAYWRKGCPVKTNTPKALASVYVWKDKVAVIIANRQAKAATVTVALDLAALGLKGKALTAVDARTGKPVALKGATLSVPLKERNYTFVVVK